MEVKRRILGVLTPTEPSSDFILRLRSARFYLGLHAEQPWLAGWLLAVESFWNCVGWTAFMSNCQSLTAPKLSLTTPHSYGVAPLNARGTSPKSR